MAHPTDNVPETPSLEPTKTSAAAWSPSKAGTAVLDTASLPLPKVRKGWERMAQTPLSEHSKIKKVWRRYGLRSQPEGACHVQGEEDEEDAGLGNELESSPVRVVKKTRLRSPWKGQSLGLEQPLDEEEEPNHAPTLWDRRTFGSARKKRFSFHGRHEHVTEEGVERHAIHSTILDSSQNGVLPEQEGSPTSLDSRLSEQFGEITVSGLELAECPPSPQVLVHVFPQRTPSNLLDIQSAPGHAEHFSLSEATLSLEQPDDDVEEELNVNNEQARKPSVPTQPHEDQSNQDSTARNGLDTQEGDISSSVSYPTLPISHDDGAQAKIQEGPSEIPPNEEFLRLGLPASLISTPSRELPGCQEAKEPSSGGDDMRSPDQGGTSLAFNLNSPTLNLSAILKSHDSSVSEVAGSTLQSENAEHPKLSNCEPASVEDGDMAPDGDNSLDELSMDIDTTETLQLKIEPITVMLEEDKAILRSFLIRAAANKATKTASMQRKESLSNRRDSDAIRHALASPRQVLQEKDVNMSPERVSGVSSPAQSLKATMDSAFPLIKRTAQEAGLDAPLTLAAEDDNEDELAADDNNTGSPRRRSSRARTKIPHLPNAAGQHMPSNIPNRIPVRTDGSERVLLNRTEAQQLADHVRRNTKKNKGLAIPAPRRLKKLEAEILLAITDGSMFLEPDPDAEREPKDGVKMVRWRESLVEYATSLPTMELESLSDSPSDELRPTRISLSFTRNSSADSSIDKDKTPGISRLRRLRGRGSVNGTPMRNILSSTLLPDEVDEEMEAAKEAASKTTAGEMPANGEKTTRIQPPKKLTLNPSLTSLSALPLPAGPGHASQLLSPAKKLGRGRLPLPSAPLMSDAAIASKPAKKLRTPRKA